MAKFEVQHHTLCDGWVCTETTYEGDDDVGTPTEYNTIWEARASIRDFLKEINDQISNGERDPDMGYDADEFRAVEKTNG